MTLTEKERELQARAKRAGAAVDEGAGNRMFNFIVSQITSAGVESQLMWDMGRAVLSNAEKNGFRCELRGIVVFPIILDPSAFHRKDFITHKRKESAFYVGKNIEFDAWMKARKPKRIRLAAENLISSVQTIPDKHLGLDNKAELIAMIESSSKIVR